MKKEILHIRQREVQRLGWQFFLNKHKYDAWLNESVKELDSRKPKELLKTEIGCEQLIDILNLKIFKKEVFKNLTPR